VKVQVISVDAKTKRIALSIKALQAPAAPTHKQKQKVAPAPEPDMNAKLAALADRWKKR
jgi:uncharacterized protein